MAKPTKAKATKKKPIEQYDHKSKKRVNNPPVGLVTPATDKDSGKKTYAYDPQLVWAGKAERTSFEVPTISLHVHERIDPRRSSKPCAGATVIMTTRCRCFSRRKKTRRCVKRSSSTSIRTIGPIA